MVTSLLVALKLSFQYIREKEEPEDGKHDKKLNQNDPPEFLSPGHIPKTTIIETDCPF